MDYIKDVFTKYKALTNIQKIALFLVLGSAVVVIIFSIFMASNNNAINNNQPNQETEQPVTLEEFQTELYEGFNEAADSNIWPFTNSVLPRNYEAEYTLSSGTFTVKRFNDLYHIRNDSLEMYFTNSFQNIMNLTTLINRGGAWRVGDFSIFYTVPEGFLYGMMLEELIQRTPVVNSNLRRGDMSIYNSVLAEYVNPSLETPRTGLYYVIHIEYQNNRLSSIRIVFPVENAGEWEEFQMPEISIRFTNVGQVERFGVSKDIINQIR